MMINNIRNITGLDSSDRTLDEDNDDNCRRIM